MDWKNITNDLGPRLFRYFLVTFPRPLAADLTQETLLRLIRYHNNGKIVLSKGNPNMVAFGIARNVKKETYATLARDNRVRDLVTQEANIRTLDSDDNVTDLRKAIKQLSEDERQVVELLIDKDLSLTDMSKILEMPIGTVKSHIHRAKTSLKLFLQ